MKKYILKNIGKRKIGLGEPPIITDNLHFIVDGDAPISVQNRTGDELFKSDGQGLKFEGFDINPINKLIKAAPLTPYTIFVDTVGGSDDTGELLNITKPFKTWTAALAATPIDTFQWTYHFICPDNTTRIIDQKFPDRHFKIKCDNRGIFNITSTDNTSSTVGTGKNIEFYMPQATFQFSGVQRRLSVSGSGSIRIECYKLIMNTNFYTHGSTISAGVNPAQSPQRSWIICDYLEWEIIGSLGYYGSFTDIYGDIVVRRKVTMGTAWGGLHQGGVNQPYTVSVNEIECNINKGFFYPNSLPTDFKLSKVSGTVPLLLGSGMSGVMNIDFNGLIINPGTSVTLPSRSGSGVMTLTGVIKSADTSQIILSTNTDGATLILDGFIGPLPRQTAHPRGIIRFVNSVITVATSFAYGASYIHYSPQDYGGIYSFEGSNTVNTLSETPQIFFDSIFYPTRIHINGPLTTNLTGFGSGLTEVVYKGSTFREKTKEVIVRNKVDIVNRELRSDVSYIIDGDIALGATDHIIVPVGGLTVNGYSFDASRLGSYGVPGHSIFVSAGSLTIPSETGTYDYTPVRRYKPIHNTDGPGDNVGIYLNGVSGWFRPELAVPLNYLHPTPGGQNYSFGYWFNVDPSFRAGLRRTICHQGYTAASPTRSNYELRLESNNHLQIILGGRTQTIDTNFNFNTWHHIEVTFDGTTSKVYYDGQDIPFTVATALQAIQTYRPFISFSGCVWAEDHASGFTEPSRIKLAKVYAYTRARSQAEALASYNNGNSLPYENESQTDLLAYYKLDQQPGGEGTGSGNLVLHNIAFTTTGDKAKVFDIWDVDGSRALEMVTVNFEGCKQVGYIHNYRQGTGITIGFYGCNDGLYFSGIQNGFKLTNTNGFTFGPNAIMFGRWGKLAFNNRFYLDINVDLPIGAIITDFGPENFNDIRLLQINTTLAKRGGILNKANTPLLFPNITPYDIKALFADNIGLSNSPEEPDDIDLSFLPTYSSDQIAIDNGLAIGFAYIESSSGVIKKLGVGAGAGSGGGNQLSQIIEITTSRNIVDSDYGRILMISAENVVLTIPSSGLRSDFTTEIDVLASGNVTIVSDGVSATLDFPWGTILRPNGMGAIYRKPGTNQYRGKGEFSETLI